jgi:catechol 2,3-dioxygenase-like lactoylglutathione lyase family enzyme
MKPRVTSFAPQFLVDDLERSIAYYGKLGFTFGEPWDGFYAIGHLDGLELHLKEAPKNQEERRQRCNDSEAAHAHRVGYEGLLCRGSRRLHHLLWRASDGLSAETAKM